MNDALGLLFVNASMIMGLQIPVHRLFLSSKYGLSGGTTDSVALLVLPTVRNMFILTKIYESNPQVLQGRQFVQRPYT